MADKNEEFRVLIMRIVNDQEEKNRIFQEEMRKGIQDAVESLQHPLMQVGADGSITPLVEDNIRCNTSGNFSIIGETGLSPEESKRRLVEVAGIVKPIMKKYGMIDLYARLIIGYPKEDHGQKETTASDA